MIQKTALLTSVLAFSLVSSTFAHPGRTDGSRGHICRTNCTKWSLEQDEYHSHNDRVSKSSSGSSSNTVSSPAPSNELSPEEIAAQQAAADLAKGESEGYDAGYADGYAAVSKNPQATGSPAYNEGYTAAYEKGYTEAAEKLEAEKATAKNEGLLLGRKTDTLAVPDTYAKVAALKATFTSAFNQAVRVRDEAVHSTRI